jgi:hypothetical protein
MKKKIVGIMTVTIALLMMTVPAFASAGDVGYIELNDATTTLHYVGVTTPLHAWAATSDGEDSWMLTIATSYDALVEITWFDSYPTNDVYELWVDGVLKGTNVAGDVGSVQLRLTTGSTYEIVVDWIYYQTNQPLISGGSYYDITFEVLGQYRWFKASGGGESYSDASGTVGHHCTLGVIGISLQDTCGIGDYVPCKGSGTFIDHDQKLKFSLTIEDGSIIRESDYLIYFRGTAKVMDIENHEKYVTSFRVGLVDDQYSSSNRFDFSCDGKYWHGTMEPDSDVVVWVWE